MAYRHVLGFSDLPSIYNISLPVGPNMPNVTDDVMLVQTLLKMANFTCNGADCGVEASHRINIDGYFGQQTGRMIAAFEAYMRENHLLLNADGVLEPASNDGYTGTGIIYKIIHLNRFAKQAIPLGTRYEELPNDPHTDPTLRRSLLTQTSVATNGT
jgi:peptidoglycan hydrolase-like protein with peptidoglycan-binding domain